MEATSVFPGAAKIWPCARTNLERLSRCLATPTSSADARATAAVARSIALSRPSELEASPWRLRNCTTARHEQHLTSSSCHCYLRQGSAAPLPWAPLVFPQSCNTLQRVHAPAVQLTRAQHPLTVLLAACLCLPAWRAILALLLPPPTYRWLDVQ